MTLPHDIKESIENTPAWQIADVVGISNPDNGLSPGAVFLDTVRVSTLEAIAELDDDDLTDIAGNLDDRFHEIADGSVDVGTYARWQTFTDLCAWDEDIAELGDIDASNLTDSVAGRALYLIADRVARSIVDDIAAQIGDRIDAALTYATELGAEHGQNAAGWWTQEAIGGRSSGDVAEIARRTIAGIDDIDPEIMDTLPSADLSGQWADGMTVADLLRRNNLDDLGPACEIAGEIGDNYEQAFNDAAQNAIVEACRATLDAEDAS